MNQQKREDAILVDSSPEKQEEQNKKRRRLPDDDGDDQRLDSDQATQQLDDDDDDETLIQVPSVNSMLQKANRFAFAAVEETKAKTPVCPCGESHTASEDHLKTIWLRKYLGKSMDRAARFAQIDWDYKVDVFKLPQNGSEMPACVVEILDLVLAAHCGNNELMFILDAIIRHQNASSSFERANGVDVTAVVQAVYDSKLLNEARFARFKQLFDNHLPILSVGSEQLEDRHTKEKYSNVYLPWLTFRDDYLDNVNWSKGIKINTKK